MLAGGGRAVVAMRQFVAMPSWRAGDHAVVVWQSSQVLVD
jgi:hypothetical protein